VANTYKSQHLGVEAITSLGFIASPFLKKKKKKKDKQRQKVERLLGKKASKKR
jgi:hypothetical protein